MTSGLPDGLFSNQNVQIVENLEGLRIENVDTFYGHLHYFAASWNILWPLGNVVVIWYIFPVLVYCVKKNLATLYGINNAGYRILIDGCINM
jgi:hypothetical protein